MMQSYLSIDGIRAVLVLFFAVAQAAMAYWPEIRGWQNTIASRSQKLDTLVVPFGPFFAIWVVIFLSCFGFAFWHGLPGNLTDYTLRRVGWLAVILFATNTLWEYYVLKRGFDWGSVAIIISELILAISAIWLSSATNNIAEGIAFWLGRAPLYFFAGWVSVASFTNLSSTLLMYNSGLNPNSRKGAVLLICIASLVATIVAGASSSIVFAVAAAWGFLGIAYGAKTKQETEVALLSLCASMAVLGSSRMF